MVFWDMRLCSLVDGSLLFRNLLPVFGTEESLPLFYPENGGSVIPCTMVPLFQSTQHCIGEDHNLNTVLVQYYSQFVLIMYTCLIDF